MDQVFRFWDDRTPVAEYGGMWEFDHIRQPLCRTPRVACDLVNDVA